jgi:hypothetical protein
MTTQNNNLLTVKFKIIIMENKWRLAKAVAFILSLTAFVYVGKMISQNGRYQPGSDPRGIFIIVDTQTGNVQYFIPSYGETEGVFHKINFKEHTFN